MKRLIVSTPSQVFNGFVIPHFQEVKHLIILQISDLSPIQFVNTFTLQVSADPKPDGIKGITETRVTSRGPTLNDTSLPSAMLCC